MDTNSCYSIQFGKISAEELLELFRQTQADFPSLTDEEVMKERSNKLSSNANFVICRNAKNEIIAYIAAYTNQPPLCYITMVSVLPNYKYQGISQNMLAYLESHISTFQCNYMKLEVRKNNLPAIAAYTKFGFRVSHCASANSIFMEKC